VVRYLPPYPAKLLMIPLYPLRFQPVLKRAIWGGRRLQSVLGKSLPPGDDYAESWEVVDRADQQSIVSVGPLAGVTLGQLVATRGPELLGRHHPQARFPLLLKFLDAADRLSLQVHPDDARAALLEPPDLGKTETWVVLEAAPGSLIYAGLKPGIDRAALERELARGTCEACFHAFQPRVGDCIFLPAGTVHAIGGGLLIAELQQASDCTFRLFDWNRVGTDGNPRRLHIDEALEVIDFAAGPVTPQTPAPTNQPYVSRLVACDKFVLDRWTFDSSRKLPLEDACRLLIVLEGSVSIPGDMSSRPLGKGDTVFLPAVLGEIELRPHSPTVMLCAQIA
jgi:mannose-6-phosphate isomerase